MSGLQECSPALPIAKHSRPYWHVAIARMDGNLSQKEIMGIIHFLGRNTKIMCQYNIGNSIMTTLEDKIFTLKQNHLVKKMEEIHFLYNLISDSEKIVPYPLSCEIINRTFTPYRNIELLKENFSLSIKNELSNFFAPEENDIAYVYFYGGINDSAEIPIELFPLFIIKIKNISNWLELINKPNFYCLKLFSHKIDKVIDISLLDNEEDVLSISIGLNASL
ncbi:Uncharacterised protein [Mycobacteroides abscessus subsp. abscessus]|nr:Uncharacterised protein [Mycobacteroides abscessus subsp. abscessus]